MVNVDIKSLLLHLNNLCTNSLQAAAGLSVSRSHYEVAVEHFLLKLLEDPHSDWPLIFEKYGLEAGQVRKTLEEVLEDYQSGNSGKPVFSPMLLDLVQEAWLIASIDFGDSRIRSGPSSLPFWPNLPTIPPENIWICSGRSTGRNCSKSSGGSPKVL